MKKTLEKKLEEQGWEKGSRYGDCDIYTKDVGMILYYPEKDTIINIKSPEDYNERFIQ